MPTGENIQEMATLSRLIYGLSSAFMLTGDDRYLRAARAGVYYQRETFRTISHDGKCCFWWFGKRRRNLDKGEVHQVLMASENPDDLGTFPLYEQIYALAGLAQYYRITSDWEVLEDIRKTITAFDRYYLDPDLRMSPEAEKKKADEDPLWDFYKRCYGGYFSHLDPSTMSYDADALGDNKLRKNWNSIGDHLPAYLINVILSLDPVPRGRSDLEPLLEECQKMLLATSELIVDRFPDADPAVPYVNERFYADWNPDHGWRWQQNRAIVGHNLKISWNLTRVSSYCEHVAKTHEDRGNQKQAEAWRKHAKRKLEYADKLAKEMVTAGIDQVRGGCFDALERVPSNGLPIQFAWGNTKDFWQQEQAILAFLILHGCSPDEEYRSEYLQLARETEAVWNQFFLDHDRAGIFFRVSDSGLPDISGDFSAKGGHSISGYHAFELNYLAHIYNRAFVAQKPEPDAAFRLHFRPDRRSGGQQSINVLPDFFRPGQLVVSGVSINGVSRPDAEVEPHNFRIELSKEQLGCEVVVTFRLREEKKEEEEQHKWKGRKIPAVFDRESMLQTR